jgi:hypothetical protein
MLFCYKYLLNPLLPSQGAEGSATYLLNPHYLYENYLLNPHSLYDNYLLNPLPMKVREAVLLFRLLKEVEA